uniref:protein kinase domain-containing protein n=1 Tax=Streptomyces asiaticus TaxID=114695 RepID=UPI00374C96C1
MGRVHLARTPAGSAVAVKIARAADVTAVTATGMRTGTTAYMAPEYIRGQDVTEAGDVFALGVIASFAATGRLAFDGGSVEEPVPGAPGPVVKGGSPR